MVYSAAAAGTSGEGAGWGRGYRGGYFVRRGGRLERGTSNIEHRTSKGERRGRGAMIRERCGVLGIRRRVFWGGSGRLGRRGRGGSIRGWFRWDRVGGRFGRGVFGRRFGRR